MFKKGDEVALKKSCAPIPAGRIGMVIRDLDGVFLVDFGYRFRELFFPEELEKVQ